MNRQQLEIAALAAADRCLKARGYVAFDEVFREMGKLDAKQWEDWRRGRIPYLERVICLNLSQINVVCRAVQASARRGSLKPSWTAYVKWGKGTRTPLRFTKSGDPLLERLWATRFLMAGTMGRATTRVREERFLDARPGRKRGAPFGEAGEDLRGDRPDVVVSNTSPDETG